MTGPVPGTLPGRPRVRHPAAVRVISSPSYGARAQASGRQRAALLRHAHLPGQPRVRAACCQADRRRRYLQQLAARHGHPQDSSSCWPEASASASTRSRRSGPSRPCTSAAPTASSTSRSATASTRGCGASSSRSSTSRCRSAGTSAWAGASWPTNSASSSRSCRPQKRVGEHWYLGTADAVYQNLYSHRPREPAHLIVLSGDHVYKMDYAKMLRFHQERGAAATLAAIEVPVGRGAPLRRPAGGRAGAADGLPREAARPAPSPASRFARLDGHLHLRHGRAGAGARGGRAPLDHARLRQGHHPGAHLAGAGLRLPLLRREQEGGKYWRDIGTLDAYFEANMDLCQVNPEFNLYDPEWPLRTYQVAGAAGQVRVRRRGRRCGQALDSIISAGCIVSGSRIPAACCARTSACTASAIDQSILMPGVRVGRHARIRRAIIDRDVFIPRGARDRLQPRGGPQAPHGHRVGRRRRHDRRRAVHRRDQRREALRVEEGIRQTGNAGAPRGT
jgi:glucose-1-phosphate adenylyltransferase